MPKFKIATPAGASFTTVGGGYEHEIAGIRDMGVMDAEIVEGPSDEAGFVRFARDADAVYAKGIRFTKAIIDGLEKCRHIALGSVGVDSVDVKVATARGIPVTNCPDTFIDEVADHAMALLLAAHRQLIAQDRMVREGRWSEGRPALLKVPRLSGLTLGFVAFGHVARLVSRRAKAFGLRMMAYDPFIEELVMIEHGVLPSTLEDVLAQSDFVSMHAPATPEAEGMFREEHFRQMKQTAVFINTGRGPTVQEVGLIRALEEGWIAHAALDVLETEPPGNNNPLLKMDNVTLSPHNASASARFDPARKRHAGRELGLTLSGRWPMSCVNPSVLVRSDLRRWQPVSMERGPNS